MSPPRLALVGTGTAVGKTTVACALLDQARATGVRVLPFKPAQSSAPDERTTDDLRLLDALAAIEQGDPLRALTPAEICPLRYDRPLAPGIADDPRHFLDARTVDRAPLQRCIAALDRAIAATHPQLVLVEPAGGLWVPMPGGTWQPEWLRTLATHAIVVGHAGLGAINAAILTIDALRELGLPPLGFVLCETTPADPSCRDNAAVIARARGLPHVGTLAHQATAAELLAPLLQLVD